jgi:hypothetical protein
VQERQPAAVGAAARVGAEDELQAGGGDEVQSGEIEDDLVGVGCLHGRQLALDGFGRGEVELAGERNFMDAAAPL